MRYPRWWDGVFLVAMCCQCGPADTVDSPAGDVPTASPTGASTDGPTTSTSTSDGSTTSTTGGTASCEPVARTLQIALDGVPSTNFRDDVILEEFCEVTRTAWEGSAWHLALDCVGDDASEHSHVIDVAASAGTAPTPAVEGELSLAARVNGCIDCPSLFHLVLRDAAGQIVFAAYRDRFPGENFGSMIEPVEFYTPFTFAPVMDMCQDEPFDDAPCDVVCSCRTMDRRLGVQVDGGESLATVLDGHTASLGSHNVHVAAMRRDRVPEFCRGEDWVSLDLSFLLWRVR